jgi:pimeloyl-ACP methyl ester carboxylesterase
LLSAPAAPADDPEDRLPRAGFFGAAAAPVTEEIRREQKLDEKLGVLVRAVFAGTAAEEAGLKPGDVITAVDGTPITGPSGYVAKLGRRKAGEKATVRFVRAAKPQTKDVTLKARPRETGTDAYEVRYGSVESRGGRLRTILTRPKDSGRHPALFVIQGLGGFSVENAPGSPKLYAPIIDEFARRGFVTLRVEKPGQGDSEGGPTQDVDFETELDGYRQALKALVADGSVDRDRVIIFGHSMGGVMGPLLAAETPVKGLAVYGTVVKTWYEYLLENTRRQMVLGGASASDVDEALRKDAAIHCAVLIEGISPQEVASAHPGLRDRIGELFTDGRYYGGRHFIFFKQLAAWNLPAAWEKFGGDALALWGKSEFVSTEADHALIAAIVNKAHPGHGTFLAMEGIDHGFNRAASVEDSFKNLGKPGEFNPAIVTTLIDWASKVVGRAKPSP